MTLVVEPDVRSRAFQGEDGEVAVAGIRGPTRLAGFGRRFVRNRLGLLGLAMVAALFLTATFAPVLAPYEPGRQDLSASLQGPTRAHLFGTDLLGRDVLSRVIYGSRTAAFVGLVTVPLALTIAVAIGSVAGYAGRRWDAVFMRLLDVFYAFPSVLGVIVIVLLLGRGVRSVILALGLFGWATMARVLRGSILVVREADYVEAARSLGARSWHIVTRYVLPNALSPVLVLAVVRLGTAVLALAGLSFVGIGAVPGSVDWGSMVADGYSYFGYQDHLWFFPAAAVVFAVLGFVFLGDGLREAIDPAHR